MDEDKINKGRRDMLKAAATFVAGAGTGWGFTRGADVVLGPSFDGMTKRIKYHFDPHRSLLDSMDVYQAEKLRYIIDLLDIAPNKALKVAGGRDHYLYPGIHHDNHWACTAVTKVLESLSHGYEKDEIGDTSTTGSFACLGGPISNLRTAMFMEYQYIDPNNARLGFRKIEKPQLKLPIGFELDTNVLRKRLQITKRSIDRDSTPSWAMVIRNEFVPTEVNRVDFLIVSRIPNWIEADTAGLRSNPNVVTTFMGAHGAATGAVELLFRDLELLKRLNDLKEKHTFFQAVIAVDKFEQARHPIKGDVRGQAVRLKSELVASEPVPWRYY